jgi:hypothetical protein
MVAPFVALGLTLMLADPQQAPPVPQPFPRPGAPPVAAPPQPRPSSQPAVEAGPTEEALGVPIYPGAQFLTSYDAGRGQRFYLFGSAATYVDLVTYYRTVLSQRGNQVYDIPATHQFDVGRFDDNTMAFPPSVTIKDFQSAVSQGYPNPTLGGEPARFPTIIQIVPAPR